MNKSDRHTANLQEAGNSDRYIFRPRKHYAWAKGALILLFLVGWAVAVVYYANQTQEVPADASETKERQLDWRQRPGSKYPTSYKLPSS